MFENSTVFFRYEKMGLKSNRFRHPHAAYTVFERFVLTIGLVRIKGEGMIGEGMRWVLGCKGWGWGYKGCGWE